MKANVIVADPPWGGWGDKLTMNGVKRGADANYDTLLIEKLKEILISDISDDNCVLALWVVGSQLQDGLDLMKAWGFRQTQTWVWVKTKNKPLISVYKDLLKEHKILS